MLCIYKRVFSYINIVRDNKYYVEDEIEPLIQNVLSRLDSNIVYTEFFSAKEKEILRNHTNAKGNYQ